MSPAPRVIGMFTLVGVGAMLALPVVVARARNRGLGRGSGLIWGGAAGTRIDQLVAPPRFGHGHGHVNDFLAHTLVMPG